VSGLEEEEQKRRAMAMANIILKQKVSMLKMKGTSMAAQVVSLCIYIHVPLS